MDRPTPPRDPGRPVLWLHVGPMKTGTTYLQQLLYANREQLGRAGLHLPGEQWTQQVRAVQDVLRMERRDRHVRLEAQGAWRRLVADVASQPGRVSLVSVEFLSFAGRRAVRRLMATLTDVDVHVLFTVRDMTAVLPSLWQTLVHNRSTFSWPDYLDAVPPPGIPSVRLPVLSARPRSQFQRTQNVPRMLSAWEGAVTPGQLHVVTVPRGDAPPDELWRRVARVLGVDPDAAEEAPARTNPSLGHPSAELVRRVNQRVGRLTRSEYNWTLKEPVALTHLARRAEVESRVRLSRPAYDLALAWNARTREVVQGAGAVVTGDLDHDLPVAPDPRLRSALPVVPEDPGTEEVLDAAVVAGRALRRLVKKRAARLRRAGIDAAGPGLPKAKLLRERWAAEPDPVEAAALDLALAVRQGALLLRRIRAE